VIGCSASEVDGSEDHAIEEYKKNGGLDGLGSSAILPNFDLDSASTRGTV
jgi:hypothetical protein